MKTTDATIPKLNSEIARCSPSLKSLKPILNAWFDVQRDYAKNVKGDLPWWYLERPQVGFLAAAAVKSRGIALEEWSTRKGQEKHKTKSGRNDLWLQRGGHEWFIEAKYLRCELADGEESCRKAIRSYMDWAKQDVCKVIAPTKPCRLAVVFASAAWERGVSPKEVNEAVNLWKRICKDKCADAVAMLTAVTFNERLVLYQNVRLIGISLLVSLVDKPTG